MKNLGDIIEEAKSGGMPTHEECYWAMLALEALSNLDRTTMRTELMKDPPSRIEFRKLHAENSLKSWHTALNKNPKDWLGPEYDPSNPEVQTRRQMHKRLFEKVTGVKL